MTESQTIRSSLQHRALLSLAIVALAHLPPMSIVQRLDGLLFDAFRQVLPQRAADLWTSLSWTGSAIWLLAIAAIVALLTAGSRRFAITVAIAVPTTLLVLSAGVYSLADISIPVAGPVLLLVTLAALSLNASRQPAPAAGAEPAPTVLATPPDVSDELGSGWQAVRDLPPSARLLPDLYRIGTELVEAGHAELAAEAFLRIVRLDPDYEDATQRLVAAAHPGAIADPAKRDYLRAEMPDSLGRYRLLEPIGQGTTGRVYLAFDPVIHRLVAVKLIDLSLERDDIEKADAEERFQREAETTGRLSHRNIITIYDMGETGGRAYIAMEYVKGQMLSRHTAPDTLLPPRLVLELGALAADGLDYAHSQNVIHRDIKPGNIMYDSLSGDLKITDFGIARLVDVKRTRTGVVLGTPSFMSPEQIEGGNVKGNTDLFALGVSLYELLTGQLPFHGTSMTKLMFVIVNEPHAPLTAVRPDLPAALDAVIDTSLRKDPESRFQRGAEMAAALRGVAATMS